MNFLNELLAAYRANTLQLSTLLDVLASRGAQPHDAHLAEVALIERLGAEGSLPLEAVEALEAKLRALQPMAPAASAPHDDATVLQPRAGQGRPPADADATVVQPSSGRPAAAPTPDADATVVQPASLPRARVNDEATVVKPATPPPDAQATSGTGATGTGTSSSFNMDSWQRVADAEGGVYACVGSVLKGRFHLEREIGRGGMGVVFLARDERKVEAHDRDPYVAVKVLNDEFRRHPDSLIALQRESRRSQSLAHDNIVRVFDFDKDDTIVFMTMEYIDGSDLKQLIRERAYNGMPLEKVRPLIEGMAWALKRAHAAGVVHSDFKPGNVMVTRDGVPKVFDFGIARAGKHMGDQVGEQTVFDAGTLGALTPAYASLEMIQGKEPTPSDDIYALGCVTFELLTGKHPFDKVSAEVAMKEGRKPPPVPGLTKRQYQTLCDAVAFTGDQRLKNAVELVEGLREVGLRERFGPMLLFGAVGAAILAGGGWGVTYYLHQRHVERVIGRFDLTQRDHYVSEDQALGALDTLSGNEQKQLVIDRGDLIQNFLLSRIDAYWNPARHRYNYAQAQHVFHLRDQLKLYSPQLDLKRSAIEKEKNDLLNQLDTRLSQRIEAGAIFAGQPDSAVAILATIRAIDPTSSLLKNAELELKYDIAIGQSLASDHLDEARSQLQQATQQFPDSARLRQRAAQLAVLTRTATATVQAAPAVRQSLPEARKALAALIARPAITADWQAQVASAMATLQGDNSAETRSLVASLATTMATQVSTQSDPMQLPRISALVDLGLHYAPQSAALKAQRSRIDALLQQQQAKLDQESAAAEVAAHIESMKRAAAANDVSKAQQALARIRTLQPGADFLKTQGPQLLAEAYLGQASDIFQHGRYQAAADTVARGLKALGSRPDLRNAQQRFALVAALMKARTQAPTAADIEGMRQQLAAARRADPDGLGQLEKDMKLHGQLPQRSLADLLASLKPAAAAPAVTPAAAPGAVLPAGTAAPTTGQPASTLPAAPAAKPSRPVAGGQLAVPAAGAASASGVTGVDPCGNPELVGKGRFCADKLSGKRGPALVVVPGLAGGKPYALSRAEISISEFNLFCATTHQCSPRPVEDRLSGSLPVTNITLSQAKAYAAWLTQASGFVYRLPTDAEWMHAAKAGGSWKQAPDSNCVPPTSNGDDGTGAPISSLGRTPNPWGLVNLTGNVWEWVVSGGKVAVRGGSFTSYWSDCTVDARRTDSGAAQNDVGLRILREIR
ncbi:MAG TPA: protein kinase [Rhodanobacter sp.]|nr:protein kinase [Rhodanobacter sp.]